MLNWVWYHRFAEDEIERVMTDTAGRRHGYSLPMGQMMPAMVEKLKNMARTELPPVVSEVIERSPEPFVQLVTDSSCPRNVFMGGKVILLGDALAGQRPHIASSCTQCTYHALLLASYLEGSLTLDEMSEQALAYTKIAVEGGKVLGAHCLDIGLDPMEKAVKWQGIWLPIMMNMRAPYVKLLSTFPAAPAA
ncbi:MAG: hypothetical protein INR71_03905 [Terriglobus roseus]|nr:hypothetical protein [Terriglobus roseus]